jgi:DNA-binding response OmpR family regulator
MARPLILCVDDDPDLLHLHTVVLQRNNYEVLGATDADSAVQLLREHTPDLIVTDHVLPGRTGDEFLEEMRRLRPGVPILLLTGMPLAAVSASTADAILEKTSGTKEFLRRVELMLGGKSGKG